VGEQNRPQQTAVLTDFTDIPLQVLNVIECYKLIKGRDPYAALMNLAVDIFSHTETLR
jgi:hypothetical protein